MYIEPSTDIRILKRIPLDNSYRNTLYFANQTEQANYFMDQTKHILNNQTYQRVNKGMCRVGIKVEHLYDCNYMMFRNTEFGNKWFYAFITKVEYINNTVSEITFEIDVMQTWLPDVDYAFKECFIEREHSETDVIGENLVPEQLELGEYVASDFSGTQHMNNYKIIIAATVSYAGASVVGGEYAGIYSGLYLNRFDDYEEANNWIAKVNGDGRGDAIVSVFMMPADFVTNIGESVKKYDIVKSKHYNDLDGYVPRNKKLFTYPYNFLYVTNLEGNHAIYPYEYFKTDECMFTLAGDYSCTPSVVLNPQNYKGVLANLDEKLHLGGFPQCSWNTDAFKAWIAQNGASLRVNTAVGLAKELLAPALLGPVGLLSWHGTVAKAMATTYEHYIMPPQAQGNTSGNTQVALRMKDFAFMHKHVTKEFASIIDDYFDMFGYATHRVKKPNISSRPHWNYVQTVGCNIFGSMPGDDIRKICDIFDKGVTFWKIGANVGNYFLDNSV